jgi:hypothetical protein
MFFLAERVWRFAPHIYCGYFFRDRRKVKKGLLIILNMSLKEFFKPTTWKIILFVVFFVVSSFIFTLDSRYGAATYIGAPFPYYTSPAALPDQPSASWNFIYLLLDIIIWYLISALIILGINKLRKH